MTSTATLTYDPYDYEIDADPHPVWRRMRDEAPLYRNDRYDFWALSRYQDVYEASLDATTFSSAHGTVLEMMTDEPDQSPMILVMDPPEHDQLRRLVSRSFTPRRMASLEDRIRELCRAYLDPQVGGRGFDYLVDFGARLPVMVIGSLLGVPDDDQDWVRETTDQLLHRDPGETAPAGDTVTASDELGRYWRNMVAERRRSPRDDMMTELTKAEISLEDGSTRNLTDAEVEAFIGLLSGAGNETVARFLGWTATTLARNPDQRSRLVADPSMIPNAVEELLRYEVPSPVQARWVTRDVELHGSVVPESSTILLLTGSAGRDERQYEDPDRFDVGRKVPHVSFGYGIHFCLGAALARMEGRIAIEETLSRFPEWNVVEDDLEMVHTSTVRGYAKVPITL